MNKESARILEDIKIEDAAFNNAYEMIVNNRSFDDIVEDAEDENFIALPFNYEEDWEVDMVLNSCMRYFIYTEEYEKCGEIKKVLDEIEGIKV